MQKRWGAHVHAHAPEDAPDNECVWAQEADEAPRHMHDLFRETLFVLVDVGLFPVRAGSPLWHLYAQRSPSAYACCLGAGWS